MQHVTGEDIEVIVCHKSDDRGKMISVLHDMSGPNHEGLRVEPMLDEVLAKAMLHCIKEKTGIPTLPLCAHFGVHYFRQQKAGQPADAPYDEEKSRVSLFALTPDHFIEFQVNFDEWQFPLRDLPYHASHEDGALNLDPQGGTRVPDPLGKMQHLRRGNVAYESKLEATLRSEAESLGLNRPPPSGTWPLDAFLKQVVFTGKEIVREELRLPAGRDVVLDVFEEHENYYLVCTKHGPVKVFKQYVRALYTNDNGEEVPAPPHVHHAAMKLTPATRRAATEAADTRARARRAQEQEKLADPLSKLVMGELPATQAKRALAKHTMDKAKAGFLDVKTIKRLEDLDGIDFMQAEEPTLLFHFVAVPAKFRHEAEPAQSIEIRFLDDLTRERWRRALAYCLNYSEHSVPWHREWKTKQEEKDQLLQLGEEMDVFNDDADAAVADAYNM